ncbi:phage/plasmid replication protein, II/X family [Paraburkholderia solisilvae]|uniref:Replication-associated protein G2P N-terminal domain-containing protein n=1 Tax=Paraburkholderia solisilvae TaxID=624376 RepID=A0A6J5ETR6_9BURK|nr:phage/plasmid replication protein, II/X family [Paraburkholderia solisilvae]CAB3768616.1 hypothetical protein LMG29739_05347 [Paraburkholderia solisilvae]
MIDFIDVTIHLQHTPFGNERTKLIENSTSPATYKRFSKKVVLQPGGSPIDACSVENGSGINIRCCPLKPLQGHNVFGTNDVCMLASTIICGVLHKLRIPYTDNQKIAWQRGDFELSELHITHRYRLPENITLKQLFGHMLRNTTLQFRPRWLEAGDGLRMEVSRSNAAWIFYDKALELDEKRKRQFKHLCAVVGDGDVDEVWERLRTRARNSIRAEVKLSDRYLQARNLDRGSAWTVETAKEIYRIEMERLRFGSVKPLEQLRSSIFGLTNDYLKRTVELWVRGADLVNLFPESTLETHRTRIRKETGIDIVLDVPDVAPLLLSEVFSDGNLLPTFPRWPTRYSLAVANAPDDRRTGRAGVSSL